MRKVRNRGVSLKEGIAIVEVVGRAGSVGFGFFRNFGHDECCCNAWESLY